MAERIYRILLWLYPAEHRQAYGDLMLQHARDLERDARLHSGWQAIILYLRLIKDGMLNAGFEQWEAIMADNRFTPASWLIVLLAAIPGLLLVFSRVDVMQLGSVLPRLVTFGYLAILVIGAPLSWYRRRRFPVWALLPAGFLLWEAVYLAGSLLTQFLNDLGWLPGMWQDGMLGFALVEVVLIVGLSVLFLRGRRLSTAVWLTISAIVVVNLLAIFDFKRQTPAWMVPVIIQFLYNSSIGLLDGLMFVAVGVLAVRQHGLLAMLVVIGGFGYMCMDSDFISGFRLNEWTWYTTYVVSMYTLYLLVAPVALLLARTRLGRLLAVFVPVGIFLVARIAVPDIVLPGPHLMPWGDILFSVNVLLIFVLAWVLYSHVDQSMHAEEMVGAVSYPPQPSLSEIHH